MSAREQEENGKTHASKEREAEKGRQSIHVRAWQKEKRAERVREGCRVAPFGGRSLLWG